MQIENSSPISPALNSARVAVDTTDCAAMASEHIEELEETVEILSALTIIAAKLLEEQKEHQARWMDRLATVLKVAKDAIGADRLSQLYESEETEGEPSADDVSDDTASLRHRAAH